MTAVAFHHSYSKIHTIATRMSATLAPFFFIQRNSQNILNSSSPFTIKVNRQMTPLFSRLAGSARLGFWSLTQLQSTYVNKKILENSIVMNPYKTEKLIKNALQKGIKKMVVSDIEELTKIQEIYFKFRKQCRSVKQPEYVWAVQNSQCDLQNILDVHKCQLPVDGIQFSSEMTQNQIEIFLEKFKMGQNIKDFVKLYETTLKKMQNETNFLKRLEIEPIISDYSETSNYMMVCRILGRDKNKQPIFDNSCLNFICKLETCNCSTPKTKVQQVFEAGGLQWAIVNPLRLDKLKKEYILE